MPPHTRRSVLAAAALLPLCARADAGASPPPAYRVGAFTVCPLRDGLFPLQPAMIPGAESPAGRALLERAGLTPAGPSPEPVNAFLIRRGARHWLFDAGCGGVFGPGFGGVAAALAAQGVAPEAIETVWLSHMHADHVGGLLLPQGGARYPNAELVMQAREAAYWRDAAARAHAPAALAPMFETALAVLSAYAGRIRTIAGEADLAPGVRALPLPGHTPGHQGVLVADGAERLLIWGDIVHSALLQMPHPDWTVVWDADPAQAVATRLRILDRAASEGLSIAGMHLAVRGTVSRGSTGYTLT